MNNFLKKLLKKEIRITFKTGEKKDNLIVEGVYENVLIASTDGSIKLINIDTISYVTIEGMEMLEQIDKKEEYKKVNSSVDHKEIKNDEIEKIKSKFGRYSKKNKK